MLVKEPRDEGERRSSGGILIPATAQVSKRLVWAEVLAVGNHVRAVEPGDRVLFSPDDRFEVEIAGEQLLAIAMLLLASSVSCCSDWVLDLDIKGFFDSIDWELLLKAIRHHTDCPWVLLYVERWLKAPVQMEDGSVVPRTAGTPQGGVISPLLANLFLHYAFDAWMARNVCAHPVRAVRGRHHLSLQERRGGAGTLERDCRPLRGLQAGAAS